MARAQWLAVWPSPPCWTDLSEILFLGWVETHRLASSPHTFSFVPTSPWASSVSLTFSERFSKTG